MRLSIAVLLAVAALVPARSGHAQLHAIPQADPRLVRAGVAPASVTPAPAVSLVAHAPQDEGASPVWLAVAGAAGGAVGLAAGGVIGGALSGGGDDDCHDFCFGEGAVPGAVVGEVVGVALGVHLANGRRGSFSTDLLASGGIAGVGLALMQAERRVAYIVPVSQIIGTVIAERRTSRRP
jgi:hypothetical protein